ncbi:MAG: hypothetical protein L3J83_10695, partial [Proteobacteria bacterium]|nr:hypothetical protein [Pseudomonadota bacterium]
MKFKHLTIIVFFLVFYTPTFAVMGVDPNKVVFADYHGKIYKVTNKDLRKIHELENLNQFFTPQTNWHQIISNAEPEISKSLIQK